MNAISLCSSPGHTAPAATKDTAMRIVADYPALTVVDRKVDGRMLTIKAGEKLAFAKETRNHGTQYVQCTASSIVSYALEGGRDPIEAVRNASERGDMMHWINLSGTSITAHQRAKYEVTLIEIGALVRFEGRTFKLVAEPNDNVGMREV